MFDTSCIINHNVHICADIVMQDVVILLS